MRVQQTLTSIAETATQRYQLVVEAWRGIFERTISAQDFGSPSRIEIAALDAQSIAIRYLEREVEAIERSLDGIALEARRATLHDFSSIDALDLTDEALELVRDSARYLHDELARQIKRDIETLVQALRRVSLEVSRSARARGVSKRAALMEYRISNRSGVHFSFQDRATRKWQSDKFVRTVWRHAALSLYNEVVLSTIADHGETVALIDHAAGSSNFHGVQVSLMSSSEFPAFSEVRDEVFHPNSDHILRARAA